MKSHAAGSLVSEYQTQYNNRQHGPGKDSNLAAGLLPIRRFCPQRRSRNMQPQGDNAQHEQADCGR